MECYYFLHLLWGYFWNKMKQAILLLSILLISSITAYTVYSGEPGSVGGAGQHEPVPGIYNQNEAWEA